MSTRLETVQVGAKPGRLSDWVISPVQFNGFVRLSTAKDTAVHSPKFICFGHQWIVTIYPGGRNDSPDGCVALRLENWAEEAIEIEFKFVIVHPNGEIGDDDGSDAAIAGSDISKGPGKFVTFLPRDSDIVDGASPVKGYRNFALWSTLLNYLVDGSLIVEVHMRTNKPGQQSAPFVPENPALQNMLEDFGNEETADVKFEVGGAVESAKGRRKRAKAPTTTFHAHHYALRLNAPALADMCKPGDNSSPTMINSVQPEIFKHLLYYSYGGKIDKEDLQQNAKDIIEAADLFGVINLKLEAEACYAETLDLDLDNVIEVLMYAESKNLALLKECCMDNLSSADKIEVAEKVSFEDMTPQLMKDLLVAQARSEKKPRKGDKFSTMRVSELRKLANEKGLGVDGTREMLIASLKDNGDIEDSED